MRKLFPLAALVALSLVGCATATPYGDFSNASVGVDKAIAADMVKKLAADYPPARTRLNVSQPTIAEFDATLLSALRVKGFAVAELSKPETTVEGDGRDELRRSTHPYFFRAPAPAQTDVEFHYVVDQVGIDDLYRVTIWLGDKSLSRAYVAQGGNVSPAGVWVRKE